MDVIAYQKRTTSGIEFEKGSSPPKVTKIQDNSYVINRLFIGDTILSVNGEVSLKFTKNSFYYHHILQEIRTAQDFYRIVNTNEPKQQRLLIKARRDQGYQINAQTVERNDVRTIIELRIRWPRRDMKMGVSMLNRVGQKTIFYSEILQEDRTVVERVEPGSIAQGHIQYADIITHVDGQAVGGMSETRKVG